jgi:hypothetical protein
LFDRSVVIIFGIGVKTVMKRTDNDTLSDINDAPDLQRLVNDKRSLKRSNRAKGNRRNRRYENRLLSAHTQEEFDDEEAIIVFENGDNQPD